MNVTGAGYTILRGGRMNLASRKKGFPLHKPFKMMLAATVVSGSFSMLGAREADALEPVVNAYPGGQSGQHLVTWLKADDGVQQANGLLVDWEDRSSNSVDYTLNGPAERTPTYTSNGINFNPAVTFNNPASWGHYATSSKLEGDKAIKIASGYAVFQWSASGNNYGALIGSQVKNGNYGQTFLGNYGNRLATGDGRNGNYNLVNPVLQGSDLTNPHLAGYQIMGPTVADHKATIDGASKEVIPKTANTSIAPLQMMPAIGATGFEGDSSNWYGYRGAVSEIVLLDEVPDETTQAKIESYLALKYGITLNGGDRDYIDSSGHVFWDESDNDGYGRRITGIGRDDAQGLMQKQSKSQSDEAVVTLALGSGIAESNAANPELFANDQAFFSFSDDGASTQYKADLAYAADGIGKLKRMERIHKTEVSPNWSSSSAITLRADGIDPTSKVQFYLAVSQNADLSDVKLYPLTNGQVTLSSSELPDGSFFTFAHVNKDLLSNGVMNVLDELDEGVLKEEDYTPDSWSALRTKLTEAQNILGNPAASQQQVDLALKALNQARQGLKIQGVQFDHAALEKGTSGSRVVVTLDRGVKFDGAGRDGFSVTVSGQVYGGSDLAISIDPLDPTKVIIALPSGLDLSEVDAVGVKYDQTGSLRGLNGVPVSSFEETAQSGLGASLQITKPGTSSGVVSGEKPEFGGQVDPGAESVTVELLDAQGQVIPGAGGAAVVDPSTGEWSFVSEAQLPPGTYTVAVTAKKGQEISTRKRTFTVVDKSALQARQEAIDAEKLNGSNYTPSSWNELQTALAEAHRVLDDPAATQAQIDTALNRLNLARLGLTAVSITPQPEPNPGSSSSPIGPPTTGSAQAVGTNKQIITVDVASGAEDLRDITKVELERTTNADGTLSDQVTFTPAKAQEAIDKALAKNDPTARILIPDATDAVSRVNVDVPKATVDLLKRHQIDLEIHNPNGVVILPSSSLTDREDSFYFRLVPVKNPQERQSVEQRAQTEQVVRQLSGNEAAQVVSRPMTIETNLSSRPVTLVLPLDGTKLPANEQERAAFLKNLGVYIEHSDGTKEVVRGTVEMMDSPALTDSKWGLRFGISKFSTFTIVSLGAKTGTHQAYVKGYTDGTLRPDQAVIRSEMAAMLARLGERSGQGTVRFSDLPQRFWARDLIGQVTEAGWMKGYGNGTFKPNGAITREEMASIVFNYLQLSKGDAAGLFPDVRAGSWSGGIIAAVQAQGIMTGDNGKFYPQRPLTRAEAVTILNRLFERGPLHGAPTPAWSDLPADHWAYHDLLEAATDHGYTVRIAGGEDWTSAR
ncbi:hypothetical protein B9G55_08995 [Saccharibacillus sp. O16]|nr:hypothetical protein B9G55_08995 [Saccharibacillus sp. O16]